MVHQGNLQSLYCYSLILWKSLYEKKENFGQFFPSTGNAVVLIFLKHQEIYLRIQHLHQQDRNIPRSYSFEY